MFTLSSTVQHLIVLHFRFFEDMVWRIFNVQAFPRHIAVHHWHERGDGAVVEISDLPGKREDMADTLPSITDMTGAMELSLISLTYLERGKTWRTHCRPPLTWGGRWSYRWYLWPTWKEGGHGGHIAVHHWHEGGDGAVVEISGRGSSSGGQLAH